jgi:hypothetical protein
MRTDCSRIALCPPDAEGMLAAAAVIRREDRACDIQFLAPHELSRRVFGLVDDPHLSDLMIIDLIPTDSLEGLLLPALEQLRKRGVRLRWLYGRMDPAPALLALSELADIVYEEGAGAWRLVCGDRAGGSPAPDHELSRFLQAIQTGSERPRSAWQGVLAALSTSWDWARIYECAGALSRCEPPAEEQKRWAYEQLVEVERAKNVVASVPVRRTGAASVAVVTDSTIPARVRPEVFRHLRPDADAIAFGAGPGRLTIVATRTGADVSSLPDLRELELDLDAPGLSMSGTLSRPRVDLAWTPEATPASIKRLLGEPAMTEIRDRPEPGPVARVVRRPEERISKGLDLEALHPMDREVLRELGDAGAGPVEAQEMEISPAPSPGGASEGTKPAAPSRKNPRELLATIKRLESD